MFNNTLSGYSGGSQNLSGVFSFSDGMGTVIENGTITTNKAFVNNSSITQNNQLATKQYVDINGASALLSSNNIWFGTNDFTSNPITAKTELNTDNSTKVATTAFIKNQNYAPLDGVNEFTNINTFKNNAIEANIGINSAGRILITRAPGDVALQLQDTTSLNSNSFSVNGNTASYSMNGTSSGHSFFVRTSIGATSNVLSLTNTNVTITSTSMVNTTATDASVTDVTGKLATTRFVNSKQTNFLTLANTWTNQQTFSRTAGNTNLRLLDSTNNSTFSFATNNNQVNMVMSNNDSKIFFNTNSPTGVQSDTLIINTTTTTLNTTNPLVQNATMPASTDSSNKTPTTAWVQSAISTSSNNLLSSNNTWSGTNNYSISFPTCSVTIPASSDSSTKLATTQWTQSVISSLIAGNTTWTGANTFQKSGIDIPLFISSSSQTNYKGCHFISSGAGNYNPIVQANEYVIFGYNPTALDLSTLTLCTHSSTGSGIKITNNLTKILGPNEFDTKIKTSRTSAPTSQCLGHTYKVECLTGTTPNFYLSTWNGSTVVNLYSYTFDDSTDNKRYGTYLVKVALNYENSTATVPMSCNVNTSSATDDLSANMQSCGKDNTILIGTNYQYTLNFSFVEPVYSTKTFYLNVKRTTSGVGGFTNTSFISWTRIA